MFRRYNYYNFLVVSVILLTFLGFYVLVLLTFNLGLGSASRAITIPVRLLIGCLCLLVFLYDVKRSSISSLLFLCFASIYLVRIVFDSLSEEYFYLPYTDLIFYFFSFVVIPFLSLCNINFRKINVERIFNVFLFSALSFVLLSNFLYFRFIGSVGRLSSSRVGEEVVSPLILSYCAALVVGVLTFYLLYNKTSLKKRCLIFLVIVLAVIPFFLGASRGGIIALFFPFLILWFSKFKITKIQNYILILCVVISSLVILDSRLNSGLIGRTIGTVEAIQNDGSSASRLHIWTQSLNQFSKNPILGDKLNTDNINHYPHNIYIEVLQTTGILGFFPFFILTMMGFVACVKLIKRSPQYSWICVIFLQALIQHAFSGAVYTAAWFWTSLAIVLAFKRSVFIKLQE